LLAAFSFVVCISVCGAGMDDVTGSLRLSVALAIGAVDHSNGGT
jgi:hypothetical protein